MQRTVRNSRYVVAKTAESYVSFAIATNTVKTISLTSASCMLAHPSYTSGAIRNPVVLLTGILIGPLQSTRLTMRHFQGADKV